MITHDALERNKNVILNFAVIILSLVIALQLYRSANSQISTLTQQKNDELEKNKVVEDIAGLERKAEAYKKVFVKRDLASVMDVISGIAKESSVKIISVKPFGEDSLGNYLNSAFLINFSASSYHVLGDFISRIENHKDIYQVSEVNINSIVTNEDSPTPSLELNVSLKINTIAYL